jgi:hypothetical protein
MKDELKKRSMEDLCNAVKDYSYWQGKLTQNQIDLNALKSRITELQKNHVDIEAKVHKCETLALEMALEIKADK